MKSDSSQFKSFLEDIRGINGLIDQASALYSELSVLKHMLATEEFTQDTGTKQLQELTHEFQTLLTQIQQRIDVLDQHPKPTTASSEYLHTTHIKGVTERVQKVLKAFRKEEAVILEDEKVRLGKIYRIAKPDATTEELDLLEDTTQGPELLQAAFALGNKEAQATIQQAKKRHTSIQAILNDLQALNTIADRLQKTIAESDDALNTISYNMHTMNQKSTSTNAHLITGIKYRKRQRRFRLFFTIIGLVIITIFLIFLLKFLTSLVK
ncbi:syntaxin 1B/2/3 [Nematocida homosporus]|uniref:syntaxin 1B/2/3 n=1 Tax=Nematocida homosporus TaxID=1912981 RepID=UPI002220E274|nr:syntaxin 1B/2/3 [Nematocida homosporus]KAI5186527.1 syntaxin 1B/2/3 [Nematocida homosporus]